VIPCKFKQPTQHKIFVKLFENSVKYDKFFTSRMVKDIKLHFVHAFIYVLIYKLTKFDSNYIHIHDETVTIIYLGETFNTCLLHFGHKNIPQSGNTLLLHTQPTYHQPSSNTSSFICLYTIYVCPYSKTIITN
jgi:hypothetical protein